VRDGGEQSCAVELAAVAAVADRGAPEADSGCALPARARHRAPEGARVRHGDGRSAHGCGSPRLGFVFDQSAMVLAVDPSSVFGIGASGT